MNEPVRRPHARERVSPDVASVAAIAYAIRHAPDHDEGVNVARTALRYQRADRGFVALANGYGRKRSIPPTQ